MIGYLYESLFNRFKKDISMPHDEKSTFHHDKIAKYKTVILITSGSNY